MSEYYLNDGQSKTVETGNYKGYEWKIRTNWGRYPSAYVALPESHNLYGTMYDDIRANLHVHGGLTYGNGRPWIGWDYGHLGDFNPATEKEGYKWTRDDIYEEILACIDALIEDDEAYRVVEQERQRQAKEWEEKKKRICSPCNGRKIYRAVGESDRDWHPCYECGHMAVIRDVSPWFLDKACAEAWVFENSHEREYIETSMVYDDIFFESVEH